MCTSRIGTVALSLSTSIDARRTRDTALIVGHLLVGDDEDDDGSHGSAAAHFPPLTRHYVSAKVCRAAVLVFICLPCRLGTYLPLWMEASSLLLFSTRTIHWTFHLFSAASPLGVRLPVLAPIFRTLFLLKEIMSVYFISSSA